MSAYICDPEHFAALAVYAIKRNAVLGVYQVLESDPTKLAELIAGELAVENIRSVAARYPQDKSGSRPGPCMTDEEIISESHRFARLYSQECPQLSDVDLLAMLGCYDYQACETSDYSERMASKQIELLRAQIMQVYPNKKPREVPNYDNAIRDFRDGMESETLPVTQADKAASAAKVLADEAIQRAALLAKYAHLQHTSDKSSGHVLAAKNIRTELKRAFPSIKFKVRSDSFSMGNSVRIDWTDGPTVSQVEQITDKYQYGSFDGMTDCYNYENSQFCDLFGGSKYVTCHRDYSAQFADEVIAILAFEDYPDAPLPTGEDYKQGRLNSVGPVAGDYDKCWQRLIYRKMVTISKAA